MASSTSFWCIILAINLSSFLVLLEGTIVSTAVPSISSSLKGSGDVWIGSAYNLTAAALMPVAGGLAHAIGRRPIILGALVTFSIGSTFCGIAKSISSLIAGRVIQGIGGAGVFTSCAIILSDLVPLSERGVFNGIYQMTWCFASAAGPAIGGLFAAHSWQWIFFINLPLSLPAMILIIVFLRLKRPQKKLSDTVYNMDWIGMFLVSGSSVSMSIALVWAGVTYEWSSFRVIVPFGLGIFGFFLLAVYEWWWATNPLIPIRLITNRTTLSGYIQIFILPIPFLAVIFYMPVYLQACKDFSNPQSGLILFGVAVSTPVASVVTGLVINMTQTYRPQIWLGWVTTSVGFGLLSTLTAASPLAVIIVYESLLGIGCGILFAALYFPVLAPLPISSAASGIAFFTFLRMFAQIWGINFGAMILQSELTKRLPSGILKQGSEFMDLVSLVTTLEEPFVFKVRQAFSESLRTLWQVMAGLGAVGFIASLAMQHVILPTALDSEWGMEDRRDKQTV